MALNRPGQRAGSRAGRLMEPALTSSESGVFYWDDLVTPASRDNAELGL